MDVSTFVQQHEGVLRSLLKTLCGIPAPSGKEHARASFCKAWLLENGAEGVYIDRARNVIFPLNCEKSEQITVLAAHTDTVFPDLAPLPYSEDEENIYCPGVGDNTVSVAILLLTAKFFLTQNITPKDGLLFVFNSCEEGLGNLLGVKTLFSNYAGRIARFVALDAKIGQIHDRTVGSHRYEVTLQTNGGHSFNDFGEPNAIARLSKIVSAIYDITVPVVGESKTTYNVGIIEGGTSVNTIAQSARMLCEYRSDNAACLAQMEERFAEIFFTAEMEDTLTVERIGERPCAAEDEQGMDALCTVCKEVVETYTKEQVVFSSASTDCNIPRSLGIPAVCIGVFRGGGAHTREEWVEKKSLVDGLAIAIQTALRLSEGNE